MSGLAAMQAEGFAGAQNKNIDINNVEALKAISSVQRPSIAKMSIKLQQLVQQGVLTPEMAETMLQQASAYNDMDPKARNAIVEMVDTKGFDPQSRAALYDAQQETGAQERGGREAILQDAAARGVSGSGIEMASQMSNQQGAATRLANQGFQAAADANQRHMQAVQGLATMDSQKAQAEDAINQFNAANRQSVENLNVGARNSAQAQNLAEKQRISDTNIGLKNQQEVYNKGLYQQDFANQMAKGQAFANAAMGASQQNQAIADRTQAPATGVTSGMANKWSDENLKTDIEKVDPEEMLNNLTGYSYKYKDPEMGEGEQVGVMSQDLKEAAPQAVTDTPEGQQIDFSKMGGPMLAALTALNERLNDLEGKKSNDG